MMPRHAKIYFKASNGWAGASDLVVMGGDSCYEGCGFESQHHLLNRHFFTYICCKNGNVFTLVCGGYYNSIFPTFRRIKSRRLIEVLPVLTTAND